MFELSLVSWKSEVPEVIKKNDPNSGEEVNMFSGKMISEDYPIRENLSTMLRSPGVFEDANDVAEAVYLAHMIKDTDEESIIVSVDQRQIMLLKKCLDAHLKAAANQRGNFGGPIHEPLIVRIVELAKQAKVK